MFAKTISMEEIRARRSEGERRTMKPLHASTLTFFLLLCPSFAWVQQYPPPATPPTFLENQKKPSTTPDQTPGQQYPPVNPTQTDPAGQTGTPAMSSTQAQNQVQDALRKQMPASADSVVVTILSDNRIQLSVPFRQRCATRSFANGVN